MEPKQVQLSLGFIAVVNRTPIEVEEDTPAQEVRARERLFFTTDAEMNGLEKDYWGFDTLVSRIVAIQAERVREVKRVAFCLDTWSSGVRVLLCAPPKRSTPSLLICVPYALCVQTNVLSILSLILWRQRARKQMIVLSHIARRGGLSRWMQ